MAPLGFFSGAAASATQDSMTKWRELFLREKDIESRQEIATADRKSRERIARQGMDANEALAILNNEAALERMTQGERFGFIGGIMQQAFQGNLELDAVPQLRNTLEQWNMAEFVPMLESSIPSLIKPQDALDFSQSLAAAAADPEQAVGVDLTLAPQYFDKLADTMGWDADTRETMEKAFNERVDAVANQRELASNANQRALDTALRQGEANVAQTQAQTVETQARTELIGAQTDMTQAELKQFQETAPLLVQDLQNRVDRGTIELEHLPELMQANVRTAVANADSAETQASILQDTSKYLVGQERERLNQLVRNNELTAIEADIAESEYRVALATESSKIALAENNVDLAAAQLEDVLATTEQRYADIKNMNATTEAEVDYKRALIEDLAFETQANSMSLISDLVARGDSELLSSMGPKALQAAGFSEETSQQIISNVQDKSRANWTHERTMQEIRREAAIAERDLLQFDAETAQERWDFQQWKMEDESEQEWERISQGWRGLEIEASRATAYAQSVQNAGTAGGGAFAGMDEQDLIQATTGMTGNQFAGLVGEFNALTASLEDPTQSHIREAITTEAGSDYDQLLGMVERYAAGAASARGITPQALRENPGLMRQLLPAAVVGTDVGRLILEDLGFAGNPENNPDGPNIDLEGPQATGAVADWMLSNGMGNDSQDLMDTSETFWQELPEDEQGKYTVQADGSRRHYATPAEFQADVRDELVETEVEQQELQQAYRTVANFATELGYNPPGEDGYDYETLTEIRHQAQSQQDKVDELIRYAQQNPRIPESQALDLARESGLPIEKLQQTGTFAGLFWSADGQFTEGLMEYRNQLENAASSTYMINRLRN